MTPPYISGKLSKGVIPIGAVPRAATTIKILNGLDHGKFFP